MNRLRVGIAAALSVAALAAGVPAPAWAEVLPSDIVVIEDTTGSIEKLDGPLGDNYLKAVSCAVAGQGLQNLYDAIFVFRPEDPILSMWSTPSGVTTRQQTKGLGIQIKPLDAAGWCSARLAHAVKMNGLAKFPDDPTAEYTQGGTNFSGVEVMGHELGHHWMVGVSYKLEDDPADIKHCNLRMFMPGENQDGNCDGYRESAWGIHWSPYFNSGGIMFGNRIEDLGNDRFRFYNDGLRFGPLDQYLMGLRHPEQVGPLLRVEQAFAIQDGSYPQPKGTEVIVDGRAKYLSINDVIRAMGARYPETDPCHWKGAVVFVYPKGQAPTQARLKKLAAYATAFEAWYPFATDQRGSIDLTRDGRGHGTAGCPAPGNPPPTDAGGGEDVATVADDGPAADAADVPGAPDLPGLLEAGGENGADVAGTDRGTAGTPDGSAGDGAAPEADVAIDDGGSGASGGGCATGGGVPGGFAGLLVLAAVLAAAWPGRRRMTGIPKEVP